VECPFCKSINIRVLESRTSDDSTSIRRRRECIDCNERFTTYERVEFTPIIVVKKSGSREIYSRDKLLQSIVRACSKDQIETTVLDEIIDRVEKLVYRNYSREIPSSDLGEMLMAELKKSEPMAFLRYASIFKRINSLDEFLQELNNIQKTLSNV
jgi:transcriptional repressor NrdR